MRLFFLARAPEWVLLGFRLQTGRENSRVRLTELAQTLYPRAESPKSLAIAIPLICQGLLLLCLVALQKLLDEAANENVAEAVVERWIVNERLAQRVSIPCDDTYSTIAHNGAVCPTSLALLKSNVVDEAATADLRYGLPLMFQHCVATHYKEERRARLSLPCYQRPVPQIAVFTQIQ